MGSPDLFRALTRSLKGGRSRSISSDSVRLTPQLAVVVAVLYMMAVDGDISDRESSQLQSVVGADSDILHLAIAYAESRSVDQFIAEAPPLLDAKGRVCLLMNVCDSLMADGDLAPAEMALFDRLLGAFGHSRASFGPYFDIIASKDRMSVLGDFDAAAKVDAMTPPKALVVALLYMMSADGSMGEEEIGRLNVVVGSCQALLKASLRYVGQVRAAEFLAAAANVLDERQRQCVLLNVCDTMLSDHQVAGGERELFRRMLAAFGVEAKSFDKYLSVIYLKNEVPRDPVRSSPPVQTAIPGPRSSKRSEGVVFERKRTWEEETGEAGDATRQQTRGPGASAKGRPASEMDTRISRTMQDNIDRMSQELDGGLAMDTLESNSRDDGPADRRALRDGEGAGGASQDHLQGSGAAGKARHRKNDSAMGEARTMRDADGRAGNGQAAGHGGTIPGRHLRDGEGDSDVRALQDAGSGAAGRQGGGGGAAVPGRHWKDADGAADARALRDADGAADARALKDGGGAIDGRRLKDADGAATAHGGAGQGATTPGRHWKDGGAVGDMRALQDADGPVDRQQGSASGATMPGRHWQDADTPGEARIASDAGRAMPATHLVDDRRSFDGVADEDNDGPVQGEQIAGRMGIVSDRTRAIQGHLEAMTAARTITAANKLPKLPHLPFEPRREAGSDPANGTVARRAADPDVDRKNDADWTLATAPGGDGTGLIASISIEDALDGLVADHSRMLLAADEGGPILTDSQATATREDASLNTQLRQWSAILLPALFVTFGSTMIGETVSERSFVTSENMATDARIVHQMASVQQTVYRIAPDAVALAVPAGMPAAGAGPAAATAVSTAASTAASTPVSTTASTTASATTDAADTGELTDRQKADSFLERRKQELMSLFRQHQGASALAAERQQWFVYAKSIVLLGLGMAFWGVLFRSLRMLQVSTAVGIVSLLLTINGYGLFLRF